MDNIEKEHFFKIKARLMESLANNFILPYDDPAFDSNETSKAFMLQARRKIAGASNDEQIVEALTKLKKDYTTEGPYAQAMARDGNDSFKENVHDFYMENGLYNPELFLQNQYNFQKTLDEIDKKYSTPDESNNTSKFGAFTSFIKDKLEKMGFLAKDVPEENLKHKPHSKWTEEEFYKHHAPLCTDFNYQDEICEPASRVAAKYKLCGIDKVGHESNPNINSTAEDMKNFIKSLDKHLGEASRTLGIAPDCFGLDGKTSYAFLEQNVEIDGLFNAQNNKISIVPKSFYEDGVKKVDSFAATLVHEWTHALDSKISIDYKTHLKNEGRDDSTIGYFTSIYEKSVVLDGSEASQKYEAFQKFLAGIISKDPKALQEAQKKGQKEISQSFYFETLGADYFTLPQDTIDKLNSDDTFRFIRNKILAPEDKVGNKQLLDKMKEIIPEHITPHMDTYINLVKSSALLDSAPAQLKKLDNIKSLGNSRYIENAKYSDNILNNQSKTEKAMKWDSSLTATSNYFESSIEAVARYMESQTFNKEVLIKDQKNKKGGLHCYFTPLDPKFENSRKELFTSCFGADKVFDRSNEFNVKSATEMQSIKPKKFLTVTSEYIKLMALDNQLIFESVWAKVHDLQIGIREGKEMAVLMGSSLIEGVKNGLGGQEPTANKPKEPTPEKEKEVASQSMSSMIQSIANESGINLKEKTSNHIGHQSELNSGNINIKINRDEIQPFKTTPPENKRTIKI